MNMKRALALGLAALVAASSAAVTTAEAQPGWKNGGWNQGYNYKKRYNKNYYKNYNNYNPVAPFLFGSIVGLAIGSALAPPPPPYPYPYPAYGPDYGYGSPHVQWCLSHYRTYNPQTNTYFVRVGVPAVCISPYRY
jgi:BA14K-like protein